MLGTDFLMIDGSMVCCGIAVGGQMTRVVYGYILPLRVFGVILC